MLSVKQLHKAFVLPKKEAKKAPKAVKHAVSNLSFECRPGEVLALLGSNGAGKTTTLRLLSSALEPDSGEIWLDGIPVHQFPRRARGKLGFLSNATPLYRRLSVRENLIFFARLYNLPRLQAEARVIELSRDLHFEHFLDQKVDSLSTGMAQKASIARSILHDPVLLILDEPTTGLDVESSEQILDFIRQQRLNGKAVIFSTHHMNEVELLADRLCLIHSGQNCFTGTLSEARHCAGMDNMTQVFLKLIGKEAV